MTMMSRTVYVARGHGGSAMRRARPTPQAVVDAGLPVGLLSRGDDEEQWKRFAEFS